MAGARLALDFTRDHHFASVLENEHLTDLTAVIKWRIFHAVPVNQLAIGGLAGYPYSARSRSQILSSIALILRP